MSLTFTPQLFRDFFSGLHGHPPYPWQERLAAQVIAGSGWPEVIDLPTGSGKTACIDIAVLALACGRGPRRIFFVVDRKTIVDQVYENSLSKAATELDDPPQGALALVREELLRLAGGGDTPLAKVRLRGGAFRNKSWVRSPLQPTVISTTVDQVGSGLLFRGYGVSASSQPIHAGLIAHDAILFLDEAHCSQAFARTLSRIERFREGSPLPGRFQFVEMTATPSQPGGTSFKLLPADEEDTASPLYRRLHAPKPARLVLSKHKTADSAKLAADLVREARQLAARPACKRIAVMVNRVDTAVAVARALNNEDCTLVTGRMRPVDRGRVNRALQAVAAGAARSPDEPRSFIVSTQCLEVGADLDFDALVTELPSIDALLQRFGRLNRAGQQDAAQAVIVVPADDAKKPPYPYGPALPAAREWLAARFAGHAERSFSIRDNGQSIPELWDRMHPDDRKLMLPAAPDPPCLLPAHLDALVQTNPKPEPEPSVEFFLHGRQSGAAEIGVLWRADLTGSNKGSWATIVRTAPPAVNEILPVKIWTLREWLLGRLETGDAPPECDLEGPGTQDSTPSSQTRPTEKTVLVWRASAPENKQLVMQGVGQLRPGDTVVLPASEFPGTPLGYFPPDAIADVAGQALWENNDRLRLRIHPAILDTWPSERAEPFRTLLKIPVDHVTWDHCTEAAKASAAAECATPQPLLDEWLLPALQLVVQNPFRRFRLDRYPGPDPAWIVESRRTLTAMAEDAGDDATSNGAPVLLKDHTAQVCKEVESAALALLPADLAAALTTAARWHDTGKIDERFQTRLFHGNAAVARLAPAPLAKGLQRRPGSRENRTGSPLLPPDGFRHELLSLQFAQAALPPDPHRDLILHLIASHHGYCRAFPPVVLDGAPPPVSCHGVNIESDQRLAHAPHRLDQGIAERFWRLTRQYGWWGLAYLESLLRVSDWKASSQAQIILDQQTEKEANQ
ncbi:MAG TPA: type I-U CRISPR-associated helicase/endonuclease Cas3 [Bryobacteraceae bacterium]|nr:type I-U CRISPR-associated helicase/endonuclease Cas3 [Bryobacteraceae bacterium]